MATERGVYECLTPGCAQRAVAVEHAWDAAWPLARRQHRCGACRKRMLLVRIKRGMPADVKRRLRAAQEARNAVA